MNVPKTNLGTCEVPRCDENAMVGCGNPPKWLCFIHYESYLQDAAALLSRIRDHLAVTE